MCGGPHGAGGPREHSVQTGACLTLASGWETRSAQLCSGGRQHRKGEFGRESTARGIGHRYAQTLTPGCPFNTPEVY